MLTPLGEILETLTARASFSAKLAEKLAILLWPRVADERISAHTQAMFVKGGILWVSPSSSSWATELSFHKKELIKKINQKLKKPVIKDIRTLSPSTFTPPEAPKDEPSWTDIPLSKEALDEIETTLKDLDEKLKKALTPLLIKEKKWKIWRELNKDRTCSVCHGALSENGRCPWCELYSKIEEEEKLRRLFLKTPWIKFGDAKEKIKNITEQKFFQLRKRIAQEVIEEANYLISSAGSSLEQIKIKLMTYAMLKSGKEPVEISDEELKKLLGEKYIVLKED